MEYFVSYCGTLFLKFVCEAEGRIFWQMCQVKEFLFFYFHSLSTVTVQD